MTRVRCQRWSLGLAAVVLGTALAWAAPGQVEKIEVQGLFRMSRASFLQAFGIREGDPYDVGRIRTAFRRLWDMGLFSDLAIEAEDGPDGGKVLIVRVRERPTLSSVTYEDNKVLNQTQIEDRLRERDLMLELGRPLDMKRVYLAEAAIRDLLGEKGYLDATVKAQVEPATETSYRVKFLIRPGTKTRIRKIDFRGNTRFSDRVLRKQLKLTKPWRWYWPWSKKSLYHPFKWDQDVSAVRDLYLNLGYLDVEIQPPVVEIVEKKKKKKGKKKAGMDSTTEAEGAGDETDAGAGGAAPPPEENPRKLRKRLKKLEKARKELEKRRARLERVEAQEPKRELPPKKEEKWYRKRDKRVTKARARVEKAESRVERLERAFIPQQKKWVVLTVHIVEGPQYRLGKVEIEGNRVFSDEELRAVLPLREGIILSEALVKAGVERVKRKYEDRGHLYANVVRRVKRHEGEPVADLVVSIEEDVPYHVDTIEFVGNTATKDRVLRREFLLNEQELFSRTKLDVSMQKVNQLGYVEAKEDPVLEPDRENQRVRIRVPVEEKGRNEIQVGGGYSGLDGAFFQGVYSTRNFLGQGQILSLSMQVGGRSNRYFIQFTEPYFLGRPWIFGFSLFRSDLDFGSSLSSSSNGGSLTLGRQVGVFSRFTTRYDYQSVQSTGFTFGGGSATNRISSLTPTYQIFKINNPFRPNRGWSLRLQAQAAGGPLGGDTSFYRPIVEFTGYRKAFRRSFFGLHVNLGQVRAFDEGARNRAATVAGVPRFQRFFLGGDTLGPRVFQTRTITPLRFVKLDADGAVELAVKDPSGFPVADFDRNRDGILDRRDLVELGGDRFFLVQSELTYPVNEQMEVALFADIGNALLEDMSWGFTDARISAGVEVRFYLPVFPVPLRLIYGFPIRKLDEDRTSNFTFSIGRSF